MERSTLINRLGEKNRGGQRCGNSPPLQVVGLWLVVGPALWKIWKSIVWTPLKNMSSSIGMMIIPNINGNIKLMATSHHQPAFVKQAGLVQASWMAWMAKNSMWQKPSRYNKSLDALSWQPCMVTLSYLTFWSDFCLGNNSSTQHSEVQGGTTNLSGSSSLKCSFLIIDHCASAWEHIF